MPAAYLVGKSYHVPVLSGQDVATQAPANRLRNDSTHEVHCTGTAYRAAVLAYSC